MTVTTNYLITGNVDSQVQSLVSGDGFPSYDFLTPVGKAFAQAFHMTSLAAAPTVPETVPTAVNSGNNYFVDKIGGNNSNAGTTQATAWQDLWKVIGGSPIAPPAGSTIWLAADSVFEYVQDWTAYKSTPPFNQSGTMNSWNGTASAPIVIRPYYPRGYTTSKPTISWYALMQSGDWTQETGISGGKVWSAAWSKAGNAFYNTFVAFGADRRIGVAWLQQNTSGAPASLTGADQYAVDASKVYVYVPDGTNPISYYGQIRVFGGNTVSPFCAYAGARNIQFNSIAFSLVRPAYWLNTQSSGNAISVDFAFCTFDKCAPIDHKNSATTTAVEDVITFRYNTITNQTWAAVKIQQTGGVAGNTNSYDIYGNWCGTGNLANSTGGSLCYIQCTAGTRHHVWGNYVYGAINGVAGEQIDGCGIYADVGSDKIVVNNNVVERCGKAIQFNSMSGQGVALANHAIDCGQLISVTNTTGDLKAPSVAVTHNTWQWTGRIKLSDLRAGSNIGGTGVGDWAQAPVIEITNSQANTTSNAAYKYQTVTVVNNLAINLSGSQQASKKALVIHPTWTVTQLVAGNGACGLSSTLCTEAVTLTDYSTSPGFFSLVGSASDAGIWLSKGTLGTGRPGIGSPIAGLGIKVSQQYQDIRGRNFAALPTIGCYEVNA